MKKGKFQKQRNKSFALLLALVLLIGCIAGGTIAWLIAESKTVTNTFVAGQVGELTLKENNAEIEKNEYVIVPGVNIPKDPKVSYAPAKGNDVEKVPVYVFVKITADEWTKSDNTYSMISGDKTMMSWTVADEWKLVPGETDVYYIAVAKGNSITDQEIIEGSTITVNSTTVNEDNIEDLADASDLEFSVYAIQQGGFEGDPAAAWTALNP